MSDLTATNCGCSDSGNSCCNILIWLLLLSFFCGGNGCGNGCGNGNSLGLCGDNSCLWIILLLFFCGGNGCGCNNGSFC